jgi:hypothetical protein
MASRSPSSGSMGEQRIDPRHHRRQCYPGCAPRPHDGSSSLRRISLKRLAALSGAAREKAEADRRRETLRVTAIEREYRAKLDDLRHNYALRVTVEWVQALELSVPVQRLEVQIKRRKGERLIRIDWR